MKWIYKKIYLFRFLRDLQKIENVFGENQVMSGKISPVIVVLIETPKCKNKCGMTC
jgi:hypothetical protein